MFYKMNLMFFINMVPIAALIVALFRFARPDYRPDWAKSDELKESIFFI